MQSWIKVHGSNKWNSAVLVYCTGVLYNTCKCETLAEQETMPDRRGSILQYETSTTSRRSRDWPRDDQNGRIGRRAPLRHPAVSCQTNCYEADNKKVCPRGHTGQQLYAKYIVTHFLTWRIMSFFLISLNFFSSNGYWRILVILVVPVMVILVILLIMVVLLKNSLNVLVFVSKKKFTKIENLAKVRLHNQIAIMHQCNYTIVYNT